MKGQIKCAATSCVHNMEKVCYSDVIQVSEMIDGEDHFPYCDTYTVGEGFAWRAPISDTMHMAHGDLREYSAELLSTTASPCNDIACALSDCVYNDDKVCVANKIKIDRPQSSMSTICFCDTYREE